MRSLVLFAVLLSACSPPCDDGDTSSVCRRNLAVGEACEEGQCTYPAECVDGVCSWNGRGPSGGGGGGALGGGSSGGGGGSGLSGGGTGGGTNTNISGGGGGGSTDGTGGGTATAPPRSCDATSADTCQCVAFAENEANDASCRPSTSKPSFCCASDAYAEGGEGSCACRTFGCSRRTGRCDCAATNSAFYPDTSCTGRVCCVIKSAFGVQCSCDDSWSACPASTATTQYRTVSSCSLPSISNFCTSGETPSSSCR